MGDARETEKDPDAFRTISEVAEDLSLPQHVLRFWETRFPQIKPVKRAGGRRFYRPEDVDLLRGIRQLLYSEGYTIKGVQKILKEQGIRHVQDLGIERDVAVMNSAMAERPAHGGQEGVLLGGLLGLLPRRRNKGHDDPALDELPRSVELPLPFPDPEADRDLEADQGEPVAPLPPRRPAQAQRLDERHIEDRRFEERRFEERRFEERRFDDSHYEERIYQERTEEVPGPVGRREPRLRELPVGHDVPLPFEDAPQHGPSGAAAREPAAPPRAEGGRPAGAPLEARRSATSAQERVEPTLAEGRAPSFAPLREDRPEPVVQRRPTRGPAARVSTAPMPVGDDPLLPFFHDDTSARSHEDPLEERIRRLKAQQAGPPEEYLPPKLRRATEPPRAEAIRHEASQSGSPASPQGPAGRPAGGRGIPPADAPAPTASSAWPELARASAAAERDLAAWHEQIRPQTPSANAVDEGWSGEEWAREAPGAPVDDSSYEDDGYEEEPAEDASREAFAAPPEEAAERYDDEPVASEDIAGDEETVWDDPYWSQEQGGDGPEAAAPVSADTYEQAHYEQAHYDRAHYGPAPEPEAEPDSLSSAEDPDAGYEEEWEQSTWAPSRTPSPAQPLSAARSAHGPGVSAWGAQNSGAQRPRTQSLGPQSLGVQGVAAAAGAGAAAGLALHVSAPLSARLGMQTAAAGLVRPVRVPRPDYAAERPVAGTPRSSPAPLPDSSASRRAPAAARTMPPPSEAPEPPMPRPSSPPHQPWGAPSNPPYRVGPFAGPLEDMGPPSSGAAAPAGAYGTGDQNPLPYGAAPPAPYGAAYPAASGRGGGGMPAAGFRPQSDYPPPPYGDYPVDYPVDPWGRPLPPQAVPPGGSRGAAEAVGGTSSAAPPFWQGRDPFERPGPVPIEPYLPPHLRAQSPTPADASVRPETRSGPAGNVQAVLSREDVNRLQAALYELGECRRLLHDMGGATPAGRDAKGN